MTTAYRDNRVFILYALLYTFCHIGLLFVPDALYWDDWILFNSDKETIIDTFRQAGAMGNLAGHLNYHMQSIGGWTYKIGTFLTYFLAGLALDRIIKRNKFFSNEFRIFVVIIFLIFPLNVARIAQINFPTALCYMLFFVGWYCLFKNRLAAVVLFFLSFNANSNLVFYALPFIEYMYRARENLKSKIELFWILAFFTTPFLYFFIKTNFFKPYGLYAGYNENIEYKNILPAIQTQINDWENSLLFYGFGLILFCLFLVSIRNIWTKKSQVITYSYGHKYALNYILSICFGLIILIAAITPYWILGYSPTFSDWTSRHQLLMPLGVSIIIVCVIITFTRKTRITLISLVTLFSITIWTKNYKDFHTDWNKQKALISLLSNSIEAKSANLLIIDDQTESMNAINRKYRFYEWNGILEQAFGNQKRFALFNLDKQSYFNGHYDKFFSAHYKASEHIRSRQMNITHITIHTCSTNTKRTSASPKKLCITVG